MPQFRNLIAGAGDPDWAALNALATHLERLQPQEEAFLDVFAAAPVELRQRLLARAPFVRKMVDAMRRADQPRALFALRGELERQPPGLTAGAAAVLEALSDARLADDAVLHRRGRLAAQLVDEGHSSPMVYLQRFGTSRAYVERWLSMGLLALADYARLELCTAAGLADWLQRDIISPEAFLAHAGNLLENEGLLESLVDQGRLTLAQVLASDAPPENLVYTWTRQGRVPGDTFLALFPQVDASRVTTLGEEGLITELAWANTGRMPARRLLDCVDAQRVPAEVALRHLEQAIPGPLAWGWWGRQILTEAQYRTNEVELWLPDCPLPPAQVTWLQDVPGPTWVLAEAVLPHKSGPALRQAYTTRLLAAYMRSHPLPESVVRRPGAAPAPAPWRAVQHQVATAFAWMRARVWPAAPVSLPAAIEDCQVCFEPFDSDRPAAKLHSCAHTPTFCADCMRLAVESSDTDRCPYPGCQQEIWPEEAQAIGLSAQVLDRLAVNALRRTLHISSTWVTCPTPDCAGGAEVAPGAQVSHDCRPCGKTVVLSNFEPITDANRGQLRLLVENISGAGRKWQTLPGTIRECYECGRPTEHRDNCTHMRCEHGCQRHWNFIHGLQPYNQPQGRDDPNFYPVGHALEQRYVPKAGQLQRAGLYMGLTPGAHHIDGVYAHVSANARRLGLFD